MRFSEPTNHKIDKDILRILGRSRKPLSTDEIAVKINRAWHTVQNHCKKMRRKKIISGYKVGRMNLWVKK